jgi:hypothetical protein
MRKLAALFLGGALGCMFSVVTAEACNFYDVTDENATIIVAAGSGAKLNIKNLGPGDHQLRVGMLHVVDNQPDKVIQYIEPGRGASVLVFSGGEVDKIELQHGSDWESRDTVRALVCVIP